VAEPPQLPLLSRSQQAVMASDVLDDQLYDLDVGQLQIWQFVFSAP
jgi:hypothetical protein